MFAGKDTDLRYLNALYGLRDENLMCIESTFSSFILDFCRFIEKNWEHLVEAGDKGRFSVSLTGKGNVSPSPQQGKEPEKRSFSKARSRRNVPSARQGAGETFLCLSGF